MLHKKAIFRQFSKTDVQNIFETVGFIMSILGSNSYVGRVFLKFPQNGPDELMMKFNFKLDSKNSYKYLKAK